jgi:hypothetical protein
MRDVRSWYRKEGSRERRGVKLNESGAAHIRLI